MSTAQTVKPKVKLRMMREGIEYRGYQAEGIRWMAKRNSFICGDDMGLGKSLQAITVCAIDSQQGWANRILVVAPVSVKENWGDELERWSHYTYTILQGTGDQRARQLDEFDSNVLIVNYEQVITHLGKLRSMGFDISIWDEAHMLKNRDAARTKAAIKLNRVIPRRLFLTGTPMLAYVLDLWPLLHMMDPNQWQRYLHFRTRYCVMGGPTGKNIVAIQNGEELTEALDNVMIRREKAEVAPDLPDKDYQKIWVPLTPAQQKLYDEAVDTMMMTVREMEVDESLPIAQQLEQMDEAVLVMDNALTKFMRLRQVCSTPRNVSEDQPDSSHKLDVVISKAAEVVRNQNKHVIVFTEFAATNQMICDRLEREGVEHVQFTGQTKIKHRKGVIDDWKQGPPSVLVAQISVAGVGLTMTVADTVIFAEKTFTPGLNEQAVDRVHRIGATASKVTIIEVLTRGTVEERVEEILDRKKEDFDAIVGQSDYRRAITQAVLNDMKEQRDARN